MKKWLMAANVLVFVLICTFILSPLRIGTDSTRLFVMALPAACGGAYGVDQFPPFYPHLLCLLMKLGICNSVVLWCVNFLSLGVGLIVLRRMMSLNGIDHVESMLVLLAVQLSWCVAKHCMLPQTDILLLPFFWGSILALMHFRRARDLLAKMGYLALSVLLALFAMTVRIAAIPLFGLIAVAITGLTAENMVQLIRKKSFWLLSTALVGVIIVGTALAVRYTGFDDEGGYFRMFKHFMSCSGLADFLSTEMEHLKEIMQLTVNMSAARLPTCVVIVGTFVMPMVLLAAFCKCFKWIDWYLMVILLGYGIEIFLWPCTDARFLLPVYPFAMMLIVHLLKMYGDRCRSVRIASMVYMGLFALMGFASWGWLGKQWMLGKDFYKITTELFTRRDYLNAYQRELKDIPEPELTIPVFILKKFDSWHTLHEGGKLRLDDYKRFRGRYDRGQMTDDEVRKCILETGAIPVP